MYKKVFNLEQITPMWHFQGDDPNCCLRATEVKPKLDKFVIKSLGEDNIPADWWIDKEHNSALNYKMRISCDSARTRALPDVDQYGKNLYPIFFANMGGNQGQRKTLVMFSGVAMTITSMISGLLKYISAESFMDGFLAAHSFGARQDKGFGCFCRIGDNNSPVYLRPDNASYYFDVPVSFHGLSTNYVELFKYIHYFHKVIRSGVNESGCYVKSMMYFYAVSKRVVWDKLVIRRRFQENNDVYKFICGQPVNVRNVPEAIQHKDRSSYQRELMSEYSMNYNFDDDDTLFWLCRDILGLASSQEWRAYGDTITIQRSIDSEVADDGVMYAEARLRSPIDYHPVPNGSTIRVYLIVNELPIELYNERFAIKNKRGQIQDGFFLLDISNDYGDHVSVRNYMSYVYRNKKQILDQIGDRNNGKYRYIRNAFEENSGMRRL